MDQQEHQAIDVGAILEQIRAEVRAAQAGLSDGSAHLAVPGVDWEELAAAIAEVEELRAVSAHWPLQWRTPRERIAVFVQRLIRRGLHWYIAPIVEQQNAFNNAVARALTLLLDAQRQLAAEIAQLAPSTRDHDRPPRDQQSRAPHNAPPAP
ncbi:hypothetical protein [Kallotenue papyrolyticum]|uniref:hypothetical protein n=1 Tax=Kallotenue papyrolyticum TaxID=1325125 RepID=UPI0004B90202|nr:hypothetical protein [Kallotenue papyrolyticum]